MIIKMSDVDKAIIQLQKEGSAYDVQKLGDIEEGGLRISLRKLAFGETLMMEKLIRSPGGNYLLSYKMERKDLPSNWDLEKFEEV